MSVNLNQFGINRYRRHSCCLIHPGQHTSRIVLIGVGMNTIKFTKSLLHRLRRFGTVGSNLNQRIHEETAFFIRFWLNRATGKNHHGNDKNRYYY